jgi:hypothetical protein
MWWRISWILIRMTHLVDLIVHFFSISFLCNIPSVLAAVSETAFPELLQLSESFSEMAVVSIEHARVSSFFVDTAKSAETSCLVIVDVSIALVLQLQLVYNSLNDVSIKTVYLYLGLGLDILVLQIPGVKFRLVGIIFAYLAMKLLGAILLILMVWLKLQLLIIIMMSFHNYILNSIIKQIT